MFNKAVLSSFEFPYPIFLTTWHMVVSTVLTQILGKTTDLLPGVREVGRRENFLFFISISFRVESMRL